MGLSENLVALNPPVDHHLPCKIGIWAHYSMFRQSHMFIVWDDCYWQNIIYIYISWLVWNMFYFSISWGCHHPNWPNHIFQRSRSTTKHIYIYKLIPLNSAMVSPIVGHSPDFAKSIKIHDNCLFDVCEIWGLYQRCSISVSNFIAQLVINTAVASILRHLLRHIPEKIHTCFFKPKSIP